jgi:hypothetical protein
MNQPPILYIQMVPAGVDLVIRALVKLPYGEVAPLIAELRGQADAQLAPVADTPQEDRTNDTAPVDLGTVGE